MKLGSDVFSQTLALKCMQSISLLFISNNICEFLVKFSLRPNKVVSFKNRTSSTTTFQNSSHRLALKTHDSHTQYLTQKEEKSIIFNQSIWVSFLSWQVLPEFCSFSVLACSLTFFKLIFFFSRRPQVATFMFI